MAVNALTTGLPGAELVHQGLADLRVGICTPAALLVSMASLRLRESGLLAGIAPLWPDPEMQLYRLLRAQGGDAYSRYNALRRELDSFLAALDHRRRQVARPA
ncbi:MAG: hypothetical protein ACRD2D_10150 [Terriglobales bacterium]